MDRNPTWESDCAEFAETCQTNVAAIERTLRELQRSQGLCIYTLTTRNPDFDAKKAKAALIAALDFLKALQLMRPYGGFDCGLEELVLDRAIEYDAFGPEDTYRRRGYLTTVMHFLAAFSTLTSISLAAWKVSKHGVATLKKDEFAFLRAVYHVER